MPAPMSVLWPYSNKIALLAVPVIWLSVGFILSLTRGYLNWPDAASAKVVIPLGIIIGLIPLLLALVDYVAASRAVLDIKGVKIDFSRTDIRRSSIELPENIGRPEPIISDSSPMEIVAMLETATANQVVRLDIKDGGAWWVTRLLALVAGAVRAGSPKAFVFIGVKENIEGAFLGWAPPPVLLNALLGDNKGRGPANMTYSAVYAKAVRIAKQVAMFGNPGEPPLPIGLPPDPPPLPPPSEVQRYLSQPRYTKLGEAALEQILMDQLAAYRLEDPPDRLSLWRLEELFAHCLYRDTVDLEWPKEKQITAFLNSNAMYIALVRNGRYEGLVERAEVERVIIRQLFMQAQER